MEPVRKVVTRTGRSMRGKMPSLKMKRSIGCESSLEVDAALLFDWTPEVVRFHAQPNHEFPSNGGRTFQYTPDFLLEMVDGSSIRVEVKPAGKLSDPTLRERLTHIEEHFQRSDRKFQILTEVTLRDKVLRHNFRELHYHARPVTGGVAFWETYHRLIAQDTLTFGEVQAAFSEPRDAYRLLSTRWLSFDIEQPLNATTPVFATGPEVRHDAFHL